MYQISTIAFKKAGLIHNTALNKYKYHFDVLCRLNPIVMHRNYDTPFKHTWIVLELGRRSLIS